MSTEPYVVVVGMDFSELADRALVEAFALASGRENAELWCGQHRERHGRRHTYYQSAHSGTETNFPLVFQ